LREEWELIQRARDGDRRAFRELVELHRKQVLHLAYDLSGDLQDAEDISQETFVKMYRALHTFRGDSRLSTWLHRITVNTWHNQRRSKSDRARQAEQPLDDSLAGDCAEAVGQREATPDRRAEDAFARKRILGALQRLSGRERSVFVLRHFHEYKLDEVGEALSLSTGTVKTLNFRALKKMRELLGKAMAER
jgi:RNA polymerase sigma-70 factor (ECF subfamily)